MEYLGVKLTLEVKQGQGATLRLMEGSAAAGLQISVDGMDGTALGAQPAEIPAGASARVFRA